MATMICPVCGCKFNPKQAGRHIIEKHSQASDRELMLIRDARRDALSFWIKLPVTKSFKQPAMRSATNAVQKASKTKAPGDITGKPYSGGLPSLGKKR